MKDVTYGQFMCTVRPEKAEPNQTRFTVGGDRINYPGAVTTPTAEMLVAKILFNRVISTNGCTLHDNGHLKLLPNDTATPSQIHSIETNQHT
jgi:hypothetical protein